LTVGHRHRPLRDEVLDELRRLILDGTFEPGSHLTEQAISERLHVSRLPVREAFRRLESEGLLEALPRRGVRVVLPDADELQTVHEMRVALELIAVRRTTERRDPEVFADLRSSLDAGTTAVRGDRPQVLGTLNEDFHELLARGAGSKVLVETLRSVRNQVHHLVGGRHSSPDSSWGEHSRIVEAVLAEDAELAAMLMRRHLHARHTEARAAGKDQPPAEPRPVDAPPDPETQAS
jgi:DNA-binding GntR family transcriptional regulator